MRKLLILGAGLLAFHVGGHCSTADAAFAADKATVAETKSKNAFSQGGRTKPSKRLRFRHAVSCFGAASASTRQTLESLLNSGWELPLLAEPYLAMVVFQVGADGHLTKPKIYQSSGRPDVDSAALAQVIHMQDQLEKGVRVNRDTEILAAFTFTPKGDLPKVIRAGDADVLCAIKTKEASNLDYDDDIDPEELDEAENLDPWTAWAAKVCRSVAANINNVMQLPKYRNLYLPVNLNVLLQVEVGSDSPVRVLKTIKPSGNQDFDASVSEGIDMLNKTSAISIPKGTNLKGQMTVHLIELVSH